jgi:hypothetical protein
VLAARLPAYLAAAIPLRYAAAGGCAQDDDAKHDPSPEKQKLDCKCHEGGHRSRHAPSSGHVAGDPPASRLSEAVAADYLRVALTYMLISMPHGTSTIFGVFQAILALLAKPDVLSALVIKLLCDEKFASKIFCYENPRTFCCTAKFVDG